MKKRKTLEGYLKKELDGLHFDRDKQKIAYLVLRDLCFAGSSTAKKYDEIKRLTYGEIKVDYSSLKNHYIKFISSWRYRNLNLAHTRTRYEDSLSAVLSKFTRVDFIRSCWIGGSCVDFFIPSYSLVIEVNGGIHNAELKMRKDTFRDKRIMKNLKLTVWEIENGDISSFRYKVVDFIKTTKRNDSKKVKRAWRDIYLLTLSTNYTINELSKMFDHDLISLAIQLGYLRRGENERVA